MPFLPLRRLYKEVNVEPLCLKDHTGSHTKMDLDVNTGTLPERPKLSGQSHMLLAIPPNVYRIIIS